MIMKKDLIINIIKIQVLNINYHLLLEDPFLIVHILQVEVLLLEEDLLLKKKIISLDLEAILFFLSLIHGN